MDNTNKILNEIIPEKTNSYLDYTIIHRWLIPLFAGALSFKYEFSLQKRLGKKINYHNYIACCGASIVGFLFTKYIFTGVDYYIDKQLKEKEKEKEKDKKSNIDEF
jgi:hypothetical protein